MINLWPKMALLPPVTMEKYNVGTFSKVFRLHLTRFQSWTCLINCEAGWECYPALRDAPQETHVPEHMHSLYVPWRIIRKRAYHSKAQDDTFMKIMTNLLYKPGMCTTVASPMLCCLETTHKHPQHEFSPRSLEENKEHTIVASVFLHFV